MQKNISELQEKARNEIAAAIHPDTLEELRVKYLGKKGLLTDLLKQVVNLSPAEKPKIGQAINDLKKEVSEAIGIKKRKLESEELEKKLANEKIDVSLPGRDFDQGTIHPVTQVKERIINFFTSLGFDVVSGPEIETEFYNFEALNISSHHPARAMHDTFYFGDGRLLRTHTSPVQIRTMEIQKPPFRLIAPGRVYRCDSDLTHSPMFHQVEGLMIDKNITMTNLRWILQNFFTDFFQSDINLRFRPSYFPFTEPSAEVDISCRRCEGAGCRSCKMTGWLEVLGCGMVHPKVLAEVNISPAKYQGWAFGLGIDRLAMLYFAIEDLRSLFENDLNFLRQF